ncbi:MAG: SMC-Scp complex subunit ScpB [Legionella sp.]|nr:SMC-Scp complex subunit ScpB [Legionella sp.]
MDDIEIKCIVEALLMSSETPLSIEQISSAFEEWQRPSKESIQHALKALDADYENRAIELKVLANGYCLQTREKYGLWIGRLQTEKPGKYSRALLETLAIIAYRQPVTRADIEDIRGVAVSSPMIKTLLEREWIKIAGHRDVPGKPAVFVTTKTFLDYFNLQSIDQLPPLPESSDLLPVVTEKFIEEYVD